MRGGVGWFICLFLFSTSLCHCARLLSPSFVACQSCTREKGGGKETHGRFPNLHWFNAGRGERGRGGQRHHARIHKNLSFLSLRYI